jgi:hypothetical protein
MGPFSGLFAHRRVLLLGDDRSVDFQKVRKTMALAILRRNGLPHPLARLFAPIPNGIGDHLTRPAAQGNPNPGSALLFMLAVLAITTALQDEQKWSSCFPFLTLSKSPIF